VLRAHRKMVLQPLRRPQHKPHAAGAGDPGTMAGPDYRA
jgi:hypothetical protein